ncbi:MAG: MBL fold metallo-hydrolase [Clostridiales bacterium]
MKIHFFGTCSGTEPMPNRNHTSFAFESKKFLYWFDAGENCSYTAHLMGIDILKTKTICISHTHMDHIGGLPNLFWNIRKINKPKKILKDKTIDLYIPELEVWKNILGILKYTEENFKCDFNIDTYKVVDGELFSNNEISLFALHNNHLAKNKMGEYRSFGFLIKFENMKIVYSGDTSGINDFLDLLPCDILIMETGHHKADEIARKLINLKLVPSKKLLFIHHGLEILNNYNEELIKVKNLLGEKVCFLDDGKTMEF